MSIHIEVSNLGPLRRAKIELTDLTLLVGDNNTGKTFFATIVHRVLNVSSSQLRSFRRLRTKIDDEVREWMESKILQQEGDTLPMDLPELTPTQPILEWANQFTTETLTMFGADVRRAVEYAYGVKAHELRRRTSSRLSRDCYLEITNTKPRWKVVVRFDSEDIVVEPPEPTIWLQLLLDKNRLRREMRYNSRRRDHIQTRHLITDEVIHRLLAGFREPPTHLFPDWPSHAVHLPASRAGIMESYQILAGAVIRQSAAAGISPIEFNTLPGTSADFLSYLLSPQDSFQRRRRGSSKLDSLIQKFEDSLRVEIKMQKRKNAADTIVAVTPEGTFPFSRTSSMFSELGPVLLVLKEAVGPGDHLTIDEPEAHLHPALQREVATLVANLVLAGVKIVVTTHSEFFVGEINNLIRVSELVNRDSSSHSSDVDGPALGLNRVRALGFSRNNRWCEGKPLSIDFIDGVDESTFTDVMESLYDESADLINELI